MIEKDAWYINGYVGTVILAVLILVAALSVYEMEYWLAGIFMIIGIILSTGLAFVQPNQAMIIQFLGKYGGTYRNAGLIMFLPFSKKVRISLRVKAYHSKTVVIYGENHHHYSVSLMIVYKVVDVAKAFYDIDDIEHYIDVQSEMIIRKNIESKAINQVMNDKELVQQKTSDMEDQLEQRLHIAGIELIETQLLSLPKSNNRLEKSQERLLIAVNQLLEKLETNDSTPFL